MIRRANCLSLASIAILIAHAPVDAFADTQAARGAAQNAEALVAGGNYESANETLGQVDCGNDANCQTLIDFSYGWLYESWADATAMNDEGKLVRAQSYYQRAHELNPDNVQILDNLALVSGRLGDTDAAITAVTRAVKLDPDGAYERYLTLGNLLASADRPDSARSAWQRAIKIDAKRTEAQLRLLELYRKQGDFKSLYTHSQDIRYSLPETAAIGFEYAIVLSHKEDPATAENALPFWLAIRAGLGTLPGKDVGTRFISGDWQSPAVIELRRVLHNSEGPPSESKLKWWHDNSLRRDAMGRLFRFKASALQAAATSNDLDSEERVKAMKTAMRYLSAAVEFAPKFYAYQDPELAQSSDVKLDASADLVALYHGLASSDDFSGLQAVSAEDLEQITEMLFSGKSSAYASGQLDAIQRYHTVLGMVYYETGKLESDWADNATFQLKRAISTAARIANKNPSKYQPLPELQRMLADVYRQLDMPEDSARVSLDAAMGFMETDKLAAASDAMAQAAQYGAEQQRLASLQNVLTSRQAVTSGNTSLLKGQDGTLAERLEPQFAWLADPASLGLPESFVDGQRFKTLADLAERETASGNPEGARYIYAAASEAARGQQTLTSPIDVRRIQGIEYSLKEDVDLGSREITRVPLEHRNFID